MIFACQMTLFSVLIVTSSSFIVPRQGQPRKRLNSNKLYAKPNEVVEPQILSRRELGKYLSFISIAGTQVALSQETYAAVTDETNTFAAEGSAYVIPETLPIATDTDTDTGTAVQPQQAPTDEVTITIPMSKLQSASLGIELADVEFRTNRRVYIKSVLPSSLAAQYNIQPNYVLVKINGQSAERTNAKGVAQMIGQVKQSNAESLTFTFRDDSFQQQLQELSLRGEVTTQVAPGGDTTQRNQNGSVKSGTETSQEDQKLTITQLIPPKMCRKGAEVDDLLEISYVGTLLESGTVFDGSAVMVNGKGVPGRGNDVSIYFVLGKQPFGQFPPGWDVGLSGICVGERRRIIVPPVLAYGSVGVPRRNIPPNATLVYDVSLVSINGLATPQ